jgi:hypothetical protein
MLSVKIRDDDDGGALRCKFNLRNELQPSLCKEPAQPWQYQVKYVKLRVEVEK